MEGNWLLLLERRRGFEVCGLYAWEDSGALPKREKEIEAISGVELRKRSARVSIWRKTTCIRGRWVAIEHLGSEASLHSFKSSNKVFNTVSMLRIAS